mmetsp:Transcript_40198/g.78235  ORF Transcript_40198/g.78235 Transcript_40198/m.78235 type:complete len:228 (+) Transcript_40198:846-1529(+)
MIVPGVDRAAGTLLERRVLPALDLLKVVLRLKPPLIQVFRLLLQRPQVPTITVVISIFGGGVATAIAIVEASPVPLLHQRVNAEPQFVDAGRQSHHGVAQWHRLGVGAAVEGRARRPLELLAIFLERYGVLVDLADHDVQQLLALLCIGLRLVRGLRRLRRRRRARAHGCGFCRFSHGTGNRAGIGENDRREARSCSSGGVSRRGLKLKISTRRSGGSSRREGGRGL